MGYPARQEPRQGGLFFRNKSGGEDFFYYFFKSKITLSKRKTFLKFSSDSIVCSLAYDT